MELTEQQALEIVYSIFPRLKNRRYVFCDERDQATLYPYELFIYLGRSFDSHQTTSDIVVFSFSDEYSQVSLDGSSLNITGEVKKYLEQHNAGAGL